MQTNDPAPRECACGLYRLPNGDAACHYCADEPAFGECSACEGPREGGCDHVCAACLGEETCEACE